MAHEPYYPVLSPLRTGLRGRCPRCGRGPLFAGYLNLANRCSQCGLEYAFADAGDGAPWFVMLITGAASVATALFVELHWQPAYWIHGLIAFPLVVLLPLILLRPVKGILVSQQYRTGAMESPKAR